MFGFYLTRGLNSLRQGVQRIAEGKLGHLIEVRGKDELAETALAFVASAMKVAQRVLAAIKKPVLIGDKNVEIGASLGVCIYPDHGQDSVDLNGISRSGEYFSGEFARPGLSRDARRDD